MRTWLFGAVIVIAAATATFLAVRGVRRTEADAVSPSHSGHAPTHAAMERPLTIPERIPLGLGSPPASSEGTEAVQLADSSDTPPSTANPIPERPRLPSALFEDKYRGSSRDQLVVAKAHVEDEFFSLQRTAVADCLARGNFEREVRERPPTDDIVFPPGRPMGGLVHGRKTTVLQDGRIETKTYSLPWEDYGEMYAKCDELGWLNQTIEKVNKTIRNPGS